MFKHSSLLVTWLAVSLVFGCSPAPGGEDSSGLSGHTAALVQPGSDVALEAPVVVKPSSTGSPTVIAVLPSGFAIAYPYDGQLWCLPIDAAGQPKLEVPVRFTTGGAFNGQISLTANASRLLIGGFNGELVTLDHDCQPIANGRASLGIPGVFPLVASTTTGFLLVYSNSAGTGLSVRAVGNDGQPTGAATALTTATTSVFDVALECVDDECLATWHTPHSGSAGEYDVYARRVAAATGQSLDVAPVLVASPARFDNLSTFGDDYVLANSASQARIPRGKPIADSLPLIESGLYVTRELTRWKNGFVAFIYATIQFTDGQLADLGNIEVRVNGKRTNLSHLAVQGDVLVGIDESSSYLLVIDPSTGTAKSRVLITRTRNEQQAAGVVSGERNYLVTFDDDRSDDTLFDRYARRYDLNGVPIDSEAIALTDNGRPQRAYWLRDRYVVTALMPYPEVAHWAFALVPDGSHLMRSTVVKLRTLPNYENWQRQRPDLAASGNLRLMAWTNGSAISWQALTDALVPTGTVRSNSTPAATRYDARIHWNGSQFLLVWADNRTGNFDIYALRLDANGQQLDSSAAHISTQAGNEAVPRVAWNGTKYLIAWAQLQGVANPVSSDDWATASENVYGAIVDPGLTQIGPALTLHTDQLAVDGTDVFADHKRFVVRTKTGLRYLDDQGQQVESIGIAGLTGAASIGGGHSLVAKNVVDTLGFRRVALSVVSRDGALGQPCSSPAECADGYCADGVCCASACGDTADCMACSIAAGGSADGLCSARASGAPCRASRGACDLPELCDGSSFACPVDARVASGETCRASSGTCDEPETCDGQHDACPDNAFKPNGHDCSDGLTCTGVETCLDGSCVSDPLSCSPGDACSVAACVEPGGCTNTPIVGCCLDAAACDDHDPCTMDGCDDNVCSHELVTGCRDAGGPVVVDDAGTSADSGTGMVPTPPHPLPVVDAGGAGRDAGALEPGEEETEEPESERPTGGNSGGCAVTPGARTESLWGPATLLLAGWLGRRRRQRARHS